MKKFNFKTICLLLSLLFLFFFGSSQASKAQSEPINAYFFYGTGCPHCAKEREFLQSLKEKNPNDISIYEYEIYYNTLNSKKFADTITHLGIDVGGVPFLVIGERYFIGYESDETTGLEIENELIRCMENGCKDNLAELLLNKKIIPGTTSSEEKVEKKVEEEIKIEDGKNSENTSPIYLNTPILGKINLKSISLPIATILIAFVDGFNPCAMWILIFLITMLINMKDRKKLYILGSVFIFTSGVVYFFFLSAWLNFFKFVGFVYWIKVVIGIVAVISGLLHLKNALFSKGGCHATNEKQREGIMNKIKKALGEKSYLLSIIGIVSLAISVNLIEVVCSAGLPAVYTNLLSSINLSGPQYYFYLLLYVLIFMLDDLIVFFIAMRTFEVTGIAKKYTKWSSVIGGVIILIIGIILILKPEWLMFG